MPEPPIIFFDSFGCGRFGSSWRFGGYIKTVIATHAGEVVDVLNEVERAAAIGLYSAGFVAYEAASALNQDLPSVPPVDGLPLAWFALFRERYSIDPGGGGPFSAGDGALEPLRTLEEYSGDIKCIHEYIAAGDCYQVNHTFKLQGLFQGNPQDLYARICAGQQSQFCAYLDMGRFIILSASPELFFSLKSGSITTRPMKGTARRGRSAEEDLAAIQRLRNSPKEKAENLMIVDLLRNDLGIVAETGSVKVDALFEIETFPTVHQMTSTVSAQLLPNAGLSDIFAALFPCGSVTGAPKRRSMEIIAERENMPRGVYCGTIGCVAPDGEAVFSVAIRTLLYDAQDKKLSMGVGSAITWDSEATSEYAECLNKAEFVNRHSHDFQLIESLRLERGCYARMERHLARLAASADYFGFLCDREKIRNELSYHAARVSEPSKVRLVLAADGNVEITSETLLENDEPLRVAVSAITVDSRDSLRYHKTTRRELLNTARSSHPGCDDVLLLNEYGQLTEGSYHSLVVRLDGLLVTPSISCGLLPGVLRGELLDLGTIAERVLFADDLMRAEELWLINSVRGWRRCVVI